MPKKATTQIDADNQEMQNALQVIQYTRNSLFLTGKAGTGKSTFLRYIDKNIKKKHVVLAPTGIAAINAGGSTLHSFFKLPFHPLLPNDSNYSARNIRGTLKYTQEKRKLLQELELIIIDEISMVRADIIDFIDRVLRIYCRNMREPFGGKQLLLVGDIFQLEPVVKEDERQLLQPFYPNAYFFNAHVFRQFRLVSIELRKVYRQSNLEFIHILDNIRTSHLSDGDLYKLNQRVDRTQPSDEDVDVDIDDDTLEITLSARRDTVDFINQEKLDKLDGDVNMFKGIVSGDFPESSLPTPLELELKLGAQVLFIRNDKEKRWVNGTLGVVIGFDEEYNTIQVHTDDGIDVEVTREVWSNVKYTFNEEEKKIEEQEIGTYTQYPLRLAWAITVHKSQGLTFKQVKIDFSGGGAFAAGQTYVALSRCTSLEGITLKDPIRRADVFVRPEVQQFASHYNDGAILDAVLKQSEGEKLYHDCIKAYEEGDIPTALDKFFIAIHRNYIIERPVQRRLLRRKLSKKQSTIQSQQEKIEKLEAKLAEKNEIMRKLAVEYNLLGKESEKEEMYTAALRNYQKALELCPNLSAAKKAVKRLKKRLEEK